MKRKEYLQRAQGAYISGRIDNDTYDTLLGCESIFCEDEDAEKEKEDETKNNLNVKETLEKQLKLLSERSEDIASHERYRIDCICNLSEAMCKIAEILAKCKDISCGDGPAESTEASKIKAITPCDKCKAQEMLNGLKWEADFCDKCIDYDADHKEILVEEDLLMHYIQLANPLQPKRKIRLEKWLVKE